MEVNRENYFDIAEAIHAALMLWHGGQSSELYSLLCESRFNPGPGWSESIVEKENFFFQEIEELAKGNKIEELSRLMQKIDELTNDAQ